MLGQAVLAWALALAAHVQAHTSFTTLFVNGLNQGDGTCVRQPRDPQTATYPIADITSSDMICGRDGLTPVAFTCPIDAGAVLTFAFREYPDGSAPGAIDRSHKGPCAVYLRPMADGDMAAATAAPSSGWFKIYEDGHDNSTGLWCTEKLIAARGLLSVALPRGLPAGAYLVRPELLALHEAQIGDPQFYVGCAQIYVRALASASTSASTSVGAADGPKLAIPAGHAVTIPGYVAPGEPSVTFNIYDPVFPYPLPGPPVFFPATAAAADGPDDSTQTGRAKALAAANAAIDVGVTFVPSTCLVKNANWCGVEVPRYTTENGCWDASEDCFRQEAACYASAPPSGHANCDVWDKKCTAIQAACDAGHFVGPPHPGQALQQVEASVPGPIPVPQN